MLDHTSYVPILKAKEGEFKALSHLSDKAKSTITPFFDIPDIPWNWESNEYEISIEDHFKKIALKISRYCENAKPVFVDLFFIDQNLLTVNNGNPITYLFDLFKKNKVYAIPTTGLDRDANFSAAISKLRHEGFKEVCIRLLTEDIELLPTLNKNLSELIRQLKTSKRNIHLLFDYRQLPLSEVQERSTNMIDAINKISEIHKYKSIILSASGFPYDTSEVNVDSEKYFDRTEFLLWLDVMNKGHNIARLPTFSDYCVAHPDMIHFNQRKMQTSAHIRYTTKEKWLIVKGRSTKKTLKRPEGWKQTHKLASILINKKDYYGKDYSYGDKYIFDCANRPDKPGNAMIWRLVGTNHHLELASSQISNFVLP